MVGQDGFDPMKADEVEQDEAMIEKEKHILFVASML